MKGVYYTIEAALAVLMMFVIFLLLFVTPQKNPEIDRANLKTDVYKGLDTLLAKGSLRNQTLNNDAVAIENDLDDFLPVTVTLNVEILNRSFQNLTVQTVDQPADIVGVSYFIAGDAANYTPREIRVHVWGIE